MLMLLTIFLTAILLPLASAEPPKTKGGTNCKAYRNRYGPVCYSDTSSIPRPGATLQYQITVSGNARICCKVYKCPNRCYMTYIGCGHHSWSSASLPWEGGHPVGQPVATPRMQCMSRATSRSVDYSFTTTH